LLAALIGMGAGWGGARFPDTDTDLVSPRPTTLRV
jgi:hypothetical protein